MTECVTVIYTFLPPPLLSSLPFVVKTGLRGLRNGTPDRRTISRRSVLDRGGSNLGVKDGARPVPPVSRVIDGGQRSRTVGE